MFPDNTIITIDDFIEYNFGEFEQCTADDLKDNEDFKNWIGGDIHSKTPYGESNAEFAQRVCASFEKVIDGCIKTGTQNIAIVGHAGEMCIRDRFITATAFLPLQASISILSSPSSSRELSKTASTSDEVSILSSAFLIPIASTRCV